MKPSKVLNLLTNIKIADPSKASSISLEREVNMNELSQIQDKESQDSKTYIEIQSGKMSSKSKSKIRTENDLRHEEEDAGKQKLSNLDYSIEEMRDIIPIDNPDEERVSPVKERRSIRFAHNTRTKSRIVLASHKIFSRGVSGGDSIGGLTPSFLINQQESFKRFESKVSKMSRKKLSSFGKQPKVQIAKLSNTMQYRNYSNRQSKVYREEDDKFGQTANSVMYPQRKSVRTQKKRIKHQSDMNMHLSEGGLSNPKKKDSEFGMLKLKIQNGIMNKAGLENDEKSKVGSEAISKKESMKAKVILPFIDSEDEADMIRKQKSEIRKKAKEQIKERNLKDAARFVLKPPTNYALVAFNEDIRSLGHLLKNSSIIKIVLKNGMQSEEPNKPY